MISPIVAEYESHNRVADIVRPLELGKLIGESISVVIRDAARDILNAALKRFTQRLGVVRVVGVQIVYIVVIPIKSLVYDVGLKAGVKAAAKTAKIAVGKIVFIKEGLGLLKTAAPTGIKKIDGLGVAFVVLGGIVGPLGKPIVDIVSDRCKIGIDIGVAGSGRVVEADQLAHDGIKEVLRRVIVRAFIAAGPEAEDIGLKLGELGREGVGLLGVKLPLGGKIADGVMTKAAIQ